MAYMWSEVPCGELASLHSIPLVIITHHLTRAFIVIVFHLVSLVHVIFTPHQFPHHLLLFVCFCFVLFVSTPLLKRIPEQAHYSHTGRMWDTRRPPSDLSQKLGFFLCVGRGERTNT